MNEKELQNDCLDYANKNGVFAFTVASVGIFDPVSKTFRTRQRFSINGQADSIAVMPGGYVWFVEFKVPGGKQSKAQLAFEKRLRIMGANYIVIRSFEEFKQFIEREKK